ncbi:Heat-labile enterotoxin, A chain [Moelleriella libera RCEF 2490]|uniref:Heat-labile enterotoxin, A chain n=1 Tax=Moelleriella libera RCEF 2490 TaxID=1081109 RepID=A0A168F6E9_9HYPO|nr:Heat-labile enterotoxin, A chain [Moelleriella libera RCEF 2490]
MHSTWAQLALLALASPLASAHVINVYPGEPAELSRVQADDDAVFADSALFSRDDFEGPVRTVYRGDTRSPSQLRALGGFPTEFGGPMTEDSYGLQQHHLAKCDNGTCLSAYTSTAKIFGSAVFWSTDMNARDGYVYKMRATPNMIDMNASGFKIRWQKETEMSAMGGIRWDQIEGWIPFKIAARNEFLQGFTNNPVEVYSWEDYLKQHKNGPNKPHWAKKFVENVEFNKEKYANTQGSGGQPQLAGDPENRNKYNQKTLEQYALEFMQKNGKAVDSDGKSVLLNLKTSIPSKPWSGPHGLDDTSSAYA